MNSGERHSRTAANKAVPATVAPSVMAAAVPTRPPRARPPQLDGAATGQRGERRREGHGVVGMDDPAHQREHERVHEDPAAPQEERGAARVRPWARQRASASPATRPTSAAGSSQAICPPTRR